MAAVQLKKHSPAANSFSAVWSAVVGSDSETTHTSLQAAPLAADDVVAFVGLVQTQLADWALLFAKVPSDHERRKEALGGAIKMKSAAKRFEKVVATLTADKTEADKDDKDSTEESPSEHPLAASLEECRATFHEAVLGLLELSFPVDEAITVGDFKDDAAFSATRQRMQVVADFTLSLGNLFARGSIVMKNMGPKEDAMAPEIMKMLEKQMKKEKKAKEKKDKKKGTSTAEAAPVDLTAAKLLWAETEGRCSTVLGEEVWEGLCWRRGMFLFGYIKCLVDDLEEKEEKLAADAQAPVPPEALSRMLFVDTMRSYQRMLLAQGPIPGNEEDPSAWQLVTDGTHDNESSRLFYHGIYTSTHLRGLKQLAELSYWQWKHLGRSTEDAQLAALINRKFTHVIRNIMPHAGWTADVEYDRIVEIEEATLKTSDFSKGLGGPVTKSKGGKAGGYTAGKALECPVPVASPAAAAPSPSAD